MRLDKAALFRQLGYVPHDGQAVVHRSKAKRRVLVTGSRFGKSLCAAHEAIAAAMEPRKRSMGWCVGPTLELADKVFREIVILAAEHLKHRLVELKQHEKKIVLRNLGGGLSEIRGKTSDNPVSLLGEGLDWLIVDEAAQMRPTIWSSFLSQRLIDREGWALFISTPRGRGWLWDLWRRGQAGGDPDFESWQFPSWKNPHLKRELIEAERERLPDRVFLQELGGQFIEGAGSVFRNVRACATGDWREPRSASEVFALGLDLAKVADFTALVVMSLDYEVVYAARFNRMDWSAQVARIKRVATFFNDARILLDSTGVGEPIFEDLREAECNVRGYTFTSRSKGDLVTNLALLLEKQGVLLPCPQRFPEMVDELDAFEYTVTDAGAVKTGAPSGMHDDTVIALALAAWHVTESCRYVVEHDPLEV